MDMFPPNMMPPNQEDARCIAEPPKASKDMYVPTSTAIPVAAKGASCSLVSPVINDYQLPSNSIDQTLLALAMAFVPYQMWETPYSNDVGLQRGTIFPSLDKPFLGEEAVPQ